MEKRTERKIKRNIAFALLILGLAAGMTGCGKKETTEPASTTETAATEEKGTESETGKSEESQETNESQADYVFTLEGNNSWENNGMTCTQFDGVVKNQTTDPGKDWKIVITVPEGSKMENGWNGNYNLTGTTLEITPVDYNTEIPGESEITFGFIIDTKEAFTPEKAKLILNEKEYALGVENSASESAQEDSEQETTEEATEKNEPAAKDTSGTPLANHGALSVKGTDIVDENGKVFQLKGVSTHGINWFPDYVNKDAFSSLSEYGVNAIRLAMYTADYNGYCTGGNQDELEKLIDTGVKACTELGMYVIIDWHILNDNDPNQNKDSAKSFLDKMSKKYAGNNNVIYEICNEPNGGTTWESVKSYAEEVIPVIRKNDKDALIIVGTPNWSQDVDIAAKNRIEGQENILYAVHFYASTHKNDIRTKVETARKEGLPVIVSECSICEASGNGSINYDEAQSWMKMINEYHLSYFAWNLSNKDEQSSLLKSSVTKTSGFTKEDFSETGTWFMEQFGK